MLMDEKVFTWIAGKDQAWEPFWNKTSSSPNDAVSIEKQILSELKTVQKIVKTLTSAQGNDEDTVIFQKNLASRLNSDGIYSRLEGWREYAYFFFNFFAFYGYSLSILAYYYEENENQQQPNYYVDQYMLQMGNELADWRGNFLGDFMWTLEPLVIMGSPMLFISMEEKARKLKKD